MSVEEMARQRTNHENAQYWFNFTNYDVGPICKGHMDYRTKMDLLLELINFQA